MNKRKTYRSMAEIRKKFFPKSSNLKLETKSNNTCNISNEMAQKTMELIQNEINKKKI